MSSVPGHPRQPPGPLLRGGRGLGLSLLQQLLGLRTQGRKERRPSHLEGARKLAWLLRRTAALRDFP